MDIDTYILQQCKGPIARWFARRKLQRINSRITAEIQDK
jgi:hypothetical protein